jgi:hypothetical protein
MKALVAALIGACLLALPVSAGVVNRMDPAKGAFHRVHTKKVKLACDTCHDGKAGETLQLKKTSGSQVAANREVCLGCHQSPAKPAWYGPAS